MTKYPLTALIVIFCLSFIQNSIAQVNRTVTNAAIALSQERYEDAALLSKKALKDSTKLDADNLAKAKLIHGEALLRIFIDENEESRNSEDLFAIYHLLDQAHKNDKQKEKAEQLMAGLYPLLYNTGLKYVQNKDKNSIKYLLYAAKINTEYLSDKNLSAYELLGQAYFQQGDSLLALDQFKVVMSRLNGSETNDNPNLPSAYTYYKAAFITYISNKDPEKALDILNNGIIFLEKNKTSKDEPMYLQAKKDLKALEQKISLESASNYEEVISRLERDLASDPDNYELLISYATALEKRSTNEAIIAYKKAIEVNPDNLIGHFNLAALAVNEGILLNKQYKDLDEIEHKTDEGQKLKENAFAYFDQAYKAFKQVIRIDPDNKQALKSLVQLTGLLGKTEEKEQYKEALNK